MAQLLQRAFVQERALLHIAFADNWGMFAFALLYIAFRKQYKKCSCLPCAEVCKLCLCLVLVLSTPAGSCP